MLQQEDGGEELCNKLILLLLKIALLQSFFNMYIYTHIYSYLYPYISSTVIFNAFFG